MKNVLRSVREKGNKFSEPELKALFVLVKNEQLLRFDRRGRGGVRGGREEGDRCQFKVAATDS